VLGGWSVGAGVGVGLAGLTGALAGSVLASDLGLADQQGLRSDRPVGAPGGGYPLVRTGLVLAGANRPGHEATLTAEEIAGLDLRGTVLAALSACETALGHLADWQGVQGLPRGFHEAGVKNVLTSLWSVSDAATSILMEHSYEQLWQRKQTPMQALRQAQLFVLKKPDCVRRRAQELRELLAKRGVSEEALVARGLAKKAVAISPGGGAAKGERSPLAWWAPWVLSGVPARRTGTVAAALKNPCGFPSPRQLPPLRGHPRKDAGCYTRRLSSPRPRG
jgi:hypothetical protein